MSAAQHTPGPGPWQVARCNYPQPGGKNFYIFRALLVDAGSSHYEQIRDSNSALMLFESEGEAHAAIAKATGQEGRPA